MEEGMASKLQKLEETMNKLFEMFLSNKESSSNNPDLSLMKMQSRNKVEEVLENSGEERPMFASKPAKLEFPRFAGDDPTVWHTRAEQYFDFQATLESRKVPLASYHLEGEANEWWQWLKRAYKEDGRVVTWPIFIEELWARFGPTDCEDFDEALSKIEQTGSVRDYQREFERLGNRVQGWTQKALVGTFIGGLKADIADGIRMFKPRCLEDAISLARMRDEQLTRQSKSFKPANHSMSETFANHYMSEASSSSKSSQPSSAKRLSWEEMQRRRVCGLCFNCDEQFTPGHKCQGPKLLLLEAGPSNVEEDTCFYEGDMHGKTHKNCLINILP